MRCSKERRASSSCANDPIVVRFGDDLDCWKPFGLCGPLLWGGILLVGVGCERVEEVRFTYPNDRGRAAPHVMVIYFLQFRKQRIILH